MTVDLAVPPVTGLDPAGQPDLRRLRGLLFREAGRALGTAAVVLLVAGLVTFLGTGWLEQRAQSHLRRQWLQALVAVVPASRAPRSGQPVGELVIRRLGLHAVVQQGTGRAVLRGGPGHVPGSALPGERGPVVLVGHASAFGMSFGRIATLVPGDEISLSGRAATVRYRVTTPPRRVGRLADLKAGVGDLVLITGTPRFHASELLAVTAAPADLSGSAGTTDAIVPGLAGLHLLAPSSWAELGAVLSGLGVVVVWAAGRALTRRRKSRNPMRAARLIEVVLVVAMSACLAIGLAPVF